MPTPKRTSVRKTSARQQPVTADDLGAPLPSALESSASAENSPTMAPVVNDDAIRRRAYELFEARNGVDGDSMSDWLTAERQLRGLSVI